MPVPASAQLVEIMSVGLADFVNKSGVLGDALSRLASGAVYIELNKSKRFDVTSDSTMKTFMSDLGMKSPLSRTDLLRLGAELETDAMMEGEIASVVTTKDPARVSVTLVLRMIDVASGELINGATVVGNSSPRVGDTADLDTLVTEAVNNAAYLAVKNMVEYIIPEATVQNSMGVNDLMLNKGTREGIRKGMRMVVLREKQGGGKEVVGRILVREAFPNDAIASVIIAPKGVKAEDKVRAIFEMPGYKPPVEAEAAKGVGTSSYERRGGSKKFVWYILGAAALALLVKGGSGSESGPSSSGGGTTTANVFNYSVSDIGYGTNVIEVSLWRDKDTCVAVISGTVAKSGVIRDTLGTTTVTYQEPDPADGTALLSQTSTFTALQLGETHDYYVRFLYKMTVGSTTKYAMSDPAYAGRATPLASILASVLVASTTGQSDVDLNNVDFTWTTVSGANEYIVEATVGSDTRFKSPRFVSSPAYWPPATAGESLSIEDQNIGALFSDVPEGGRIYWRVGAKNNGDTPGPPKSPVRRYIYSGIQSFVVPEQPPPPPD